MKPKILLAILCFLQATLQAQVKNCSLPNPGFVPITEMNTSTFRGYTGGLYGPQKNTPNGSYLSDALSLAKSISPLDAQGNATISGKIVFVGVGASNPRTEFEALMSRVDTFSKKRNNLLLVNTCIGGQGVQKMNDPTDTYWKSAVKQFDSLQLSFNQVQIAWVETDNTQAADTLFPRAPMALLGELKQLLYTLQAKFPNLKLCYFSARAFSGWVDLSGGGNVGRGLLAPRDYYNGWAIKWLIDSARLQNPAFIYSGASKKMSMPLFATYNYTNGSETRMDGFQLDCNTDVGGDGLHLTAAGEQKFGALMFDFFRTDNVSKEWFLQSNTAHSAEILCGKPSIYPNPCAATLHIKIPSEYVGKNLLIQSSVGQICFEKSLTSSFALDISAYRKGLYFVRIVDTNFYEKLLVE